MDTHSLQAVWYSEIKMCGLKPSQPLVSEILLAPFIVDFMLPSSYLKL